MKVLLRNKEQWERFKEHQTEMLITKGGRRMCPVISLTFEDLNPKRMYAVMIDFVLVDEFRYIFNTSSNRWAPWRPVMEREENPRMHLHAESPTTGAILMKSVLSFKKLKLTNSYDTAAKSIHVILLSTMRCYVPRIHLLESPDGVNFDYRIRKEFCFREMEFIAVSAYRNKEIAKLKIDANPFASAFRSSGLHGQAKRRRMECENASKEWKDDPPSNASSLEDSLSGNNSEEPELENIPSSNEVLNNPVPEQSYDAHTLNEIHAVIPFLKDRLRRDVSFFVYNPLYNGEHSQEMVENSQQMTRNLATNQTPRVSGSESLLACEESIEWMWGFDEQMSLRCSPEHPELKGFLPTQKDNTENVTRNSGEESSVQQPADNPENATKSRNELNDAVKATVNRRKKYLPRKLQRTRDTPLTDANSNDNGEGVAMHKDESATDQVDVMPSQPQDAKCNGEDKTERLCSDIATLDTSGASPGVEVDKAPRSQGMAPFQDQDSVLSRFRAAAGLTVTPQDSSRLPPPKETNAKVSEVHDSSSLSLPSTSENKADSSLTALMQMCSEVPWSKREQVCPLPFPHESGTASPASSGSSVPLLDGQSSESQSNSDDDELVTRASEIQDTDLPLTSMSSSSTEYVTSSAMHSTTLSATMPTPAVASACSEIPLESGTLDKVSLTTDQPQRSSTAVAIEKSGFDDRFVAESMFGHDTVSELSGGRLSGKEHPGYRPIVPAPNQSLDTFISAPAMAASLDSGYHNNDASYPIIVDCFSISENARSVLSHQALVSKPLEMEKEIRPSNSRFISSKNSPQPRVNQAYFAAPSSYQTDLTGRSGFIALDSTLPVQQALSLEKFYSFSTPYKRKQDTRRSRLYGSRHYKTTRTNFSRWSLEPVCSVIHPLTSCTRQSIYQGNPS